VVPLVPSAGGTAETARFPQFPNGFWFHGRWALAAMRATSQRKSTGTWVLVAEEEGEGEKDEQTARPLCSRHWSARSCPMTPMTSSHRGKLLGVASSTPPSPSPSQASSPPCCARLPRQPRAWCGAVRSRPRARSRRPCTCRAQTPKSASSPHKAPAPVLVLVQSSGQPETLRRRSAGSPAADN
jgi:hypothetical protein